MSREETVLGRFAKVGLSLGKLGLFPSDGKSTKNVVPLLSSLWKGKSSSTECQEALEKFMYSLERITQEIDKYSEDQKKKVNWL